jgi:hypothetical protein
MFAPNSYYDQVGLILGLRSVDSENDINQINALARSAGIQDLSSANDVRQIQAYYTQQNAPAAPAPGTPPPPPTYNPRQFTTSGGTTVSLGDFSALQRSLQQQQAYVQQQNLFFQEQQQAMQSQLLASQQQSAAALNQAGATVPGAVPTAGMVAGGVTTGGLPSIPGGRAADSLMFGGGFMAMPSFGGVAGSPLAGLGSLMIA